MTSVFCLFVIVGIAVDVMKNDDISWGEVDAQATGTRWQQEHEYVRIGVELINQHNPAGQRDEFNYYNIYSVMMKPNTKHCFNFLDLSNG